MVVANFLPVRAALAQARTRRIRGRIVATAEWCIARRADIHYAEVRPIPVQRDGRLPRLPFTTDCSGFVTVCYRAAGSPDPNGNGYSGQGYTGTLLAHGVPVPAREVLRGDVVIFGPETGHHAAVCLTSGPEPMLASHGSELGPLRVPLQAEAAHQPPGIRFRRFLL